jgi:hypothetical protein
MAQYANERARLRLLPLIEATAPDAAAAAMVHKRTPHVEEHSPASHTSALSDGSISIGSGMRAGGSSSRRSLSTDATAVELDLEDGEQEGGKLSVLLDFGPTSSGVKRSRTDEGSSVSFVYDPELVRSAVFPPLAAAPVTTSPTRKKRKLDAARSSPTEAPDTSPKMRTVILLNDTTA